MSDVDPRLVAALREQLARRPAGAPRVGWKYGSGEDERIGGEIAVGYLVGIDPGSTYLGGGPIVQVTVSSGGEVEAELGQLGGVGLRIA